VKRQTRRSTSEPMTKALKTEGGIEKSGPRKALHLVRGHFKSFSADKPLFGRVVGTFWWESSIRGSLAKGRVEKDYEVNPPQEN